MFKVAICDDEKEFRERISGYINDYFLLNDLTYEVDFFEFGNELAALNKDIKKYDMIFLDINMEGMDGIDTAKKIREYSSKICIVFVTAYMEYSLEGYKVDATRYIIKNSSNLQASINECMDSILEKISRNLKKQRMVFVEGEKSIDTDEIIFVESRLHKVEFHIIESVQGGKPDYTYVEKVYTIYKTLNEVEEELNEEKFLRIHQSFLVNLEYVRNIVGYRAVLKNGFELPIPKTKYREIKNAFIAYVGEL